MVDRSNSSPSLASQWAKSDAVQSLEKQIGNLQTLMKLKSQVGKLEDCSLRTSILMRIESELNPDIRIKVSESELKDFLLERLNKTLSAFVDSMEPDPNIPNYVRWIRERFQSIDTDSFVSLDPHVFWLVEPKLSAFMEPVKRSPESPQ